MKDKNDMFTARRKDMAAVVRRVDSAIHWITQLVLLVFIHWIAIHPVDSVIHLLNNRGMIFSKRRNPGISSVSI